jgi:hypothetical protein
MILKGQRECAIIRFKGQKNYVIKLKGQKIGAIKAHGP